MELLAAVLGFAAGALAGLFGVGGGVLFVPTLVLVLGLTQVHVGAWRQRAHGNLRCRPAVVVGLASIAGVEGGVRLARALPEDVLRRLFAVLMFAVAANIAWRTLRRPS